MVWATLAAVSIGTRVGTAVGAGRVGVAVAVGLLVDAAVGGGGVGVTTRGAAGRGIEIATWGEILSVSVGAAAEITDCGAGAGEDVTLGPAVGVGLGISDGAAVTRASRTAASTVAGMSGVGAVCVGEIMPARPDRRSVAKNKIEATLTEDLQTLR